MSAAADPVLEQLRQALAELPDLQRRAWLLCRHTGLTYAEIGERLACTARDAEAAIAAALEHLVDRVGPLVPLNYEIDPGGGER